MDENAARRMFRKPAENRGVSFDYDSTTDEIILDGKRFERWTDAEDYLESKPRLDLPQV